MLSRETLTLIKMLMRPGFLFHSLIYWARLFTRFLLIKADRLFGTNIYMMFYLPDYLRGTIRAPYNYERGFLKKMEVPYQANDVSDSSSARISIGTMELGLGDIPDWLSTFDDDETGFALHRWGWLLMLAVERPSGALKNWGLRVMKDWFFKMDSVKGHPAWESYSVSERIVNALLFLYVLRGYPSRAVDYAFMEERIMGMAEYLAGHLEFHGVLTNNHVLNNARALYMLGRLSSCERLTEIGRRIFLKESPIMITPSGFLREDSTSYHILLLRTYLEVLWVAELSGDSCFAEKIRNVASSMVRAALMISVYDEIKKEWGTPQFGDVTPDFSSRWLSGVSRSAPAVRLYDGGHSVDFNPGWNRMWDKEGGERPKSSFQERAGLAYAVCEDSGIYRVTLDNITIFWHINQYGSVPLYSHGHNDIFSFTLFWKGHPVLVDPGRSSYMPVILGLYGKMADAHNTLTIDGFDPYPATRYLYPTGYRKGNPIVQWERRADEFYLKISCDGWKRIGNIVAHREFYLGVDNLRIRDCIEGSGRRRVKTFFHFAHDVRHIDCGKSDRLMFEVGGRINVGLSTLAEAPPAKVLSGVIYPEPAGWFFPEYGKAVPAQTCIYEDNFRLPYTSEYVFEFSDVMPCAG